MVFHALSIGEDNMRINEICAVLKNEFLGSGYEYGFCLNEVRHTPNMSLGFDEEFFRLLSGETRIQAPAETMREKVGTCADTVVLMKCILDKHDIPSRTWALHNLQKNKYHTALTFSAEGKTVYLELTPQSKKPWYGKEIVYDDDRQFIAEYKSNGFEVFDITDTDLVGKTYNELTEALKDPC